MLERVKKYKLSNGKTIDEFLTEKFRGCGHWEEKEDVIEFKAPIPGLKSQAVYKWSIEGNGFYAANGKAMDLTPELNKVKLEIEKREREIPDREKAIYYFMKTEWEKLEAEDGDYIPEKHDAIVLKKANETFGISCEQAAQIYDNFEKRIWSLGKK